MKKNSVKRQNFEEWARAKQGEDCGEWWTDGGCGRVWLALEPTLSTKYIEDQMAAKEDKKESAE